LPKNAKETVDLPDFIKESVPQIQILCTFQARVAHLPRNPRRSHGAPAEKPLQLVDPAHVRTHKKSPDAAQ